MPAQLPFELLTLILDNVVEQTFDRESNNADTNTLRNCALVSSQFTAQCQKHLFSHIRIPFHKPYAMKTLQQALDVDHPELGSYVKVLSVILRTHHDVYHPGLDRILGRCTEVTELTIGCDGAQACIDWGLGTPGGTRLALESVIQSSTCKTLQCYGFRLPLSVFINPLRTCGIESLTVWKRGAISRATVGHFDGPPSAQGPSCTSLRFLSARPSFLELILTATFQDGRYLFDLTNLGTLWVDHTSWRSTKTNCTIQMLGRATCLRTLGLELSSERSTAVRDILGQHAPCFSTTLTEIRITISSRWVFVHHLSHGDPFVGVLDGLSVLSGRNVLESVWIGMTLEDDWRAGKIVPHHWLCAATAFSPGFFPSLKEVTVDVAVGIQWSSSGERSSYSGKLVQDLLGLSLDPTLDLHFDFSLNARSL